MTDSDVPSTLLFVHAHPDDETLATGVALAAYAAADASVHVLTCTFGDEGEVIPERLRHLACDRDDALGPYRRQELRRAMAAMGVHETVLGQDSTTGAAYRDSGMAGTGANGDPRSLCQAPLAQVVHDIGAHLDRLRPDVVVTYDEFGGYGHPDHIRVHQAVCGAVAQLREPDRPALYAALTPRSWAEQDRAWLAEHVLPTDQILVPGLHDEYPPGVVPDEKVTHHVTADEATLAARNEALRAHETQVRVFQGYYALSNDIAARLVDREGYARLDPHTGKVVPVAAGVAPLTGLLGAARGGRS